MDHEVVFGVMVVPTIVGLVEVAKETGLPGRFAPLVAVALGILAELAQAYSSSAPWMGAVMVGISLGLAAVGLHSGVTNGLGGYFGRNSGQPAAVPITGPSPAAPAPPPTSFTTEIPLNPGVQSQGQ